MRKLTIVVGIAVLALFAFRWTPANPGSDLRQTVDRELADPASIWAQTLRPETALSDLARFREAPVYRVALDYDPIARTVTGNQEVIFTNTTGKPLHTLYLGTTARAWGKADAEDDRFALSRVQAGGRPIGHTQRPYYAVLSLPEPLRPGESTLLTFAYKARIPPASMQTGTKLDFRANTGVYGSNAMLDGLTAAIPVVLTDVTHLDNLTETGAFANPTFALWDVRITLPEEWQPISSGLAVSEVNVADGRRTTRLASASYSFFLFATNQLQSETRQVDGVRLAVHYREYQEEAGKAILDDAAQALRTLQRVLGPYPFRELEILPMVYGTAPVAENRSGLILLHYNAFAYHAQTAPSRFSDPWLLMVTGGSMAKQTREILAHEVAHSWWGDLVWPDVLRAPIWLEGITEASGIAALEAEWGAPAAELRRNRQVYSYRYLRATGVADMPVGKPVPDPNNARDYLSMSYYKPALFYEQVRRTVGDDAYFAALRRYIEQNRFSITADRGPIEELMENPAVVALYQRWMLEAHGDEDLGVLTPEQRKELGIQ